MKAKECLIEVEAFPDNDTLGPERRRAFVKLYLRSLPELPLLQVISDACEFMGFNLIAQKEVREIDESEIPAEALERYNQFNAGFGKFHTFPV